MRLLLFLLLLLAAPLAAAQEGAASTHGQEEPALVPRPRPELVIGEVTTPRFRILYTERSEGSARALAREIEAVRESFVRVLGRDWPGRHGDPHGRGPRGVRGALAARWQASPLGGGARLPSSTASSCWTR